MSENTPPPSDPWAEATDPVQPTNGANAEAHAANGGGHSDAETRRAAEETVRAAEGAAGPQAERTEEDPVRRILSDVAAGRLTPEEGAQRIDEARRAGGAAGGAATETSATSTDKALPTTPSAAATTRVRVRAVGRRVRIIGEPFISTVAVDGPHVVRQEGDTLVVSSEGEFGASLDGFTLMRTRSLRDVQERVFELGRELSVRVNPALAVEVEVTAGSVNAERLPSLEQVRVTGGSARVRDVEGPIDVLVQAGSAQVEGRIHKGKSRLRTESGSLQLRLLPGSSVRIRPDVQLGRVQWEPPGPDNDEHVVGDGDARLDLEVVMGMATIKQAP